MKESHSRARAKSLSEAILKGLTSHKVKEASLSLSRKAIVEPLLDGMAQHGVKIDVTLALSNATFSYLYYGRS